jgi:Asp-tRNA(Asn)/Glu-tRNA(Gln) amidotransferase C subunit
MDVSEHDVRTLARMVGIQVDEPESADVRYSLNALLNAIERIDETELEDIEPTPISMESRKEVSW